MQKQTNLRELILEFLDDRPTPQSLAAICERFKAAKGDVIAVLEAALENGEIFRTKKEKYTSLRHAGAVRGRAIVRSGAPVFIRPDDGERDYYLSGGAETVMNGDIVLVQPTDTGDRPRCALLRIVRRAVTQLPAVIEIDIRPNKPKKKQKQPPKPHITALAYPLDSRLGDPIRLRTKSIEGVHSGDIAMVRMIKYPEPNQEALAEVCEVFGREDDLEALAQAILAAHHIPRRFADDVMQEAMLLERDVDASVLEGREDLRELTTFTIDGADAKDFDDAVSLEKTEAGWRLGVHIADVSHYVRHGSAIDREAQERGTSVYLPGLTLPMLPEQLCNDLCSLVPDQDRLTLSTLIDIADGKVGSYRIVPSVIHSHARLTYDQVNRMLANEADSGVPDELQDTLRQMNGLKDQFSAMRTRRGAIDLDIPEATIVVGSHMRPTAVELRERGESERMIEQFMLTANECVAEYARHLELPFLYRVHAEPDSERLGAVNELLATIGSGLRLDASPKPGDVAAVLNAVSEHPSAPDVRHTLLLAMSKARYAATPDGHYALAAQDYCHFTSPIRRYPDLFVHRMLKRHLSGKPQARLDVHALALQCSDRENAAAQAEREADRMLMAAYMARHIGRRFDARVSRIGKGAIFVALPNTIEGALPAYYMRERYVIDEQRRSAAFIHTGRVISLGDTVRVCVENAIPATGEVEFSLVDAD